MKRGFISLMAAALSALMYAQNIDTVVDSVVAHNPSVRLARQQGVTALTELKAENGLEPLEIEFSPFFMRGVNGMAESELIVSQSFRMPWVYAAHNRLTRDQAVANDIELEALVQDTRIAARNLCLEVVGLNKSLMIADRRMQIADSLLMMSQKAMLHGSVNALDVNVVRLARMEVETNRLEKRAARDKAMYMLREMNDGKEVNLDGVDWPEWSVLADVSLDDDKRLEAALRQVAATRQREKVVRQDVLPDFKLGYRRNGGSEDALHGALIGASIPLFGNKKQRTIARHQREEAETQARITKNEIERERMTLTAELQLAADKLRVTDEGVVRETLVMLRRSLGAGQISLQEYLTQSTPLYNILEERVATQTVYYQTMSSLNRSCDRGCNR